MTLRPMSRKTTKPLTIRQRAALIELSKRGVEAHYMPYMGRFNPNAYWFISSTLKHATREVHALIDRGFMDRVGSGNETKAVVNAKGRAYLKREAAQ